MEDRRPEDRQWLLDGTVYGSEAEYLAAQRKRADRRARIVARISVEEGQLLTMPGVTVEAVRRYYEKLEPFWSAEHGWHDVELDEDGIAPMGADGEFDDPEDDSGDSGFVPPRPAR